MKKRLRKLAVGGLCLITIAIIGFFALDTINIDCDGFACMGFIILLCPIFLLGIALMIISAIVTLGTYVYTLLKKQEDE